MIQSTFQSFLYYKDVEHYTEKKDEEVEKSVCIKLDGEKQSRGEIPFPNVKNSSWSVSLTFSVPKYLFLERDSPWNQKSIFGFDSGGFNSRDFHIDVISEYLCIFIGLTPAIPLDTTFSPHILKIKEFGGDYLVVTSKKVVDNKPHNLVVSYDLPTKMFSVTCDEELILLIETNETLNNYNNFIYVGSSYPSERVSIPMSFYSLKGKIDSTLVCEYNAEDFIQNEGVIEVANRVGDEKKRAVFYHGTPSEFQRKTYVDMSLPLGAGGTEYAYVYHPLHLKHLQLHDIVPYTYTSIVEDEIDYSIAANIVLQSYLAFNPHNNLKINLAQSFLQARPHLYLEMYKTDGFLQNSSWEKTVTKIDPVGAGAIETYYEVISPKLSVYSINGVLLEGERSITMGNVNYDLDKKVGRINNIICFDENGWYLRNTPDLIIFAD